MVSGVCKHFCVRVVEVGTSLYLILPLWKRMCLVVSRSTNTSTKNDPLLRICADKCRAADPLSPAHILRRSYSRANFHDKQHSNTSRHTGGVLPALILTISGSEAECAPSDTSTVILIAILAYGVLNMVGFLSL